LEIAGGFALYADMFEELCDLLGFAFGKGLVHQSVAAKAHRQPNQNNKKQTRHHLNLE